MSILYAFVGGILFLYIMQLLDNLMAWFGSYSAYKQNIYQKKVNNMFAEEQENQPAMGFVYEEPIEEEYYYEEDC